MKGNIKLACKILELLGEGFILGFPRGRENRKKFHERCDRVWYEIDRKQLYQALNRFKLQGVVKIVKDAQNLEQIRLTKRGYGRALKYRFENLELRNKKRWDKRWRVVMFDIPESKKITRDAFRRKLKHLGFNEMQKSIFVYPYPCQDEINFVVNFLNISKHVRLIESPIYPDDDLRKHFNL